MASNPSCGLKRAVWGELEALGLDLYIQAILEIKGGRASYRPQVGKKGKLYSDPELTDLITFWRRQFSRRLNTSQNYR